MAHLPEAVAAAGNGTTIVVKGGLYGEAPISFVKRGTLKVVNGSVTIK